LRTSWLKVGTNFLSKLSNPSRQGGDDKRLKNPSGKPATRSALRRKLTQETLI
jgi:hypothetical protein